jgi:hypothetical protein
LSHPAVGSYSFNGQGVGSVTVTRANDVTQHDVAADGSVMASKIRTKNGTITIVVQQTSAGALFLRKLNQFLETAHSSEWTRAVCSITSKEQTVNISCSGVSPQKTPDAAFAAPGAQVSFAYMAQTITGV